MKYTNPIIKGFNPDPSICRAGNDYFLVTSTFEYFPGIPIYHSTDLINWVQIGNCIERPDQLPFEIAEPDKGIWAPTIRYHNGKFYVTAKFMGVGNFIISSENPATGWSDPVTVDISGIDPSILFDNDRVYYCTNARLDDGKESISMLEINADTGEALSAVKQIWHGDCGDTPQYLEAPHIYHINGWYYLIAAEGGTGHNHEITCARSKNVWGPYENCPHNPILTNRYDAFKVACSGHGDLVEDKNGNWWCVHLATRPDDEWYSHMGRETFLLPVTWENEWPAIADRKSHIEINTTLLWNKQHRENIWTADFSKIEPKWLFLRNPEEKNYIINNKSLILTPSAAKISDKTGSPTMMLIRQPDIECIISAKLDFIPKNDGDEGGMTIYISNNGYYTFSKIRMDGKNYIMISKNGNDFVPIFKNIEDGKLTLRIEAFKKSYDFYYAVNNGEFIYAGNVPVLTREDACKCFTGTLIGIFVQCENKTDTTMKIFEFKAEA